MKVILIGLTIVLIVIFGLTLRNSYQSFDQLKTIAKIDENTFQGFDPELGNNPQFRETEKRITSIILETKETINNYSWWEIAINLLITIATAVSALLVAISTIKNKTIPKSTAIFVAIITFISSFLSFSLSQIGTLKGDATEKLKTTIKFREELESLKPNELNSQLPRINRKLDEEL